MYRLYITRKRGNCECIATWGRQTPRQSISALITTPCQVWSRWTCYSVFAGDTLVYAVILTFDLKHLQYNITCDVMKLCTKFERNWAIRGEVIAISVFNPITLNICYVFRSDWRWCSPSLNLRTTCPCLNYSVFDADRLSYAVTWIFDLLTLNFTVLPVSRVYVFELCTKFERNRTIRGWVIDDLAHFRMQF